MSTTDQAAVRSPRALDEKRKKIIRRRLAGIGKERKPLQQQLDGLQPGTDVPVERLKELELKVQLTRLEAEEQELQRELEALNDSGNPETKELPVQEQQPKNSLPETGLGIIFAVFSALAVGYLFYDWGTSWGPGISLRPVGYAAVVFVAALLGGRVGDFFQPAASRFMSSFAENYNQNSERKEG